MQEQLDELYTELEMYEHELETLQDRILYIHREIGRIKNSPEYIEQMRVRSAFERNDYSTD